MSTIRHHYTQDDLSDAIRQSGIEIGDVVSLQVSLGLLGLPEGATTYDQVANLVIDSFLDALSPTGTLIVPAYTYSIGKGEPFEVETTSSGIGPFPDIFRRRPESVRSRDPMLSSVGIGPHSNAILRNISNSCYGEGSTYHRLREHGAKICTLGISIYWATYRHYIEEMAEVPFRFRKEFSGTIIENGEASQETWTYFAAPLGVDNCSPNGLPLEKLMRESGLVRVAKVGRGELNCSDAGHFHDFGVEQLRLNPWLTAKGPPCDISAYTT
tara:strand:+ start:194 stop:1003 length:810 start_codon:yes stop_codon:yes gene_type:complete